MTDHRTFRALGGVDQGALPPAGEVADALRAEFERVFTLKASLRGEADAGVSPTGRHTTAQDEAKLRTLVASVEGASRFAIRLRLLSPGPVGRGHGQGPLRRLGRRPERLRPDPGPQPRTRRPGGPRHGAGRPRDQRRAARDPPR
jgi:hypothetical protein